MTTENEKLHPAQTTVVSAPSLLEQAILATKQTERSQAEDLIKVLTENALNGTVKWQKSLVVSINSAIKAIDQQISQQLQQIMHADLLKKLEGSWRGLQHLVMNSETNVSLRIKMLNVDKGELLKDLNKAVEFDQSQFFKKIYETEFGMPGGEPYSAILGDYEFSNHPDDIDMLSKISSVAAAGFCPFLSAADAKLMGFDHWTELANPRDLEKIFDSVEYAKWNSFRESDDARFICLTMPRTLARLPYGEATSPVDEFDFEETEIHQGKNTTQMAHENYCWMNAAYALATRITSAQAKYGWTTAIRGAEGGGKVETLPLHTFKSDDGDIDAQCPTEIGITDRREAELSKLGFCLYVIIKIPITQYFLVLKPCKNPKNMIAQKPTPMPRFLRAYPTFWRLHVLRII